MNHPVPDEFYDFPEDEFFFYPELSPPEGTSTPHEKRPWSRDAERAVISAMLQWPEEFIPEVMDRGGSSLFYLPAHRTVYRALVDLASASKPVDALTVADQLRKENALDLIGGPVELANLASEVSCRKNFDSWLDLLRDYRIRRELLEVCLDTRQAAHAGIEAQELLDEAESRIQNLRSTMEKTECDNIKNTVLSVVERVERISTGGPSISGLATGFKTLDEMTDGLHPGDLVLICGGPGIGKTTFATNLVEAIAVDSTTPVGVGWFALQESVSQTVERLIVSRAGFNLHEVRSGALSNPDDLEKIKEAASEVAESRIHIEEREMNMMRLRKYVRRWKQQSNIQLLVIDYLQLLKGNTYQAWGSYEVELAEISANLKSLARELHLPVVAFASVSSAIAELDKNPPRLGQLSCLWPALQDANIVACLWDRHQGEPTGVSYRELHLLKHRNGPPGKINLQFIPKQLRFAELSMVAEPAREAKEIKTGESVVVSESRIFPS